MRATSLLERSLVFVTGKGGSGKTTVAASVALAAAASGQRTIVCELGGAQRLPDAFGARGDQQGEVPLGEGLWTISIDPQDALREWLAQQPGGALAVAVLTRSQAFAHFVAAAPGAKELVTIGKIVDLTQRDSNPYDLVVVDAPSTGHALAMFAAPSKVAGIAPIGRIGRQADGLHDLLADPRSTGYVGVALAEEMPLHELSELEHDLRGVLGRDLDLIIVNAVPADWFSDADARRLRVLAESEAATGPLHALLTQHRRARVQARRVRQLRQRVATPVLTLPFVFDTEVGRLEYERFARELCGPNERRPRQRATA